MTSDNSQGAACHPHCPPAIYFGRSVCSGLNAENGKAQADLQSGDLVVFSLRVKLQFGMSQNTDLLLSLFPARDRKRKKGGTKSLDGVFVFTEAKSPSIAR